jgi:hypothetical protein
MVAGLVKPFQQKLNGSGRGQNMEGYAEDGNKAHGKAPSQGLSLITFA